MINTRLNTVWHTKSETQHFRDTYGLAINQCATSCMWVWPRQLDDCLTAKAQQLLAIQRHRWEACTVAHQRWVTCNSPIAGVLGPTAGLQCGKPNLPCTGQVGAGAGLRPANFRNSCWCRGIVPEQATGLPNALCRSRPLACQFPDQPPVWGHAPPGEGLYVPVQPPSLLVAASPAHRPHMLSCTWHTQPWPPVWLIHENRAPHNLRFFFP